MTYLTRSKILKSPNISTITRYEGGREKTFSKQPDYQRELEAEITNIGSTESNGDYIAKLSWKITARSPGASFTSNTYFKNLVLRIDGKDCFVTPTNTKFTTHKDEIISSGDTTAEGEIMLVYSSTTGCKTFDISLSGEIIFDSPNGDLSESFSVSDTWSLPPLPIYKLSYKEPDGATIRVYRTSCQDPEWSYSIDSKTQLYPRAGLYFNDTLEIYVEAEKGYKVTSKSVSGTYFVAGGSYIVHDNVTISVTTEPNPSTVVVDKAVIEDKATIYVYKNDNDCTHSIKYSFGNKQGTIVEESGETVIAWTVPESFYEEIPNSTQGECTLECETLYNGEVIGSTSYVFTISTMLHRMRPVMDSHVEDINDDTVRLTGDSSKIVKYKSTVRCSATSRAVYGANITLLTVNDQPIPSSSYVDFENATTSEYNFRTVDSRNISRTQKYSPDMIEYIPLTIGRISLLRVNMNEKKAALSIDGSFFNGSFGIKDNILRLHYRYKDVKETVFGAWTPIDTSEVIYGATTFSLPYITLDDEFDYEKEYSFEIKASDGADDVVLSEEVRQRSIYRFVPAFDWGENDFSFNVPVYMQGTKLDYIVEQGISDGWVYRKWSSRIVECWKTATYTGIDGYAHSMSGFYYSDAHSETLPSAVKFESMSYVNASGGCLDSMNFVRPFNWRKNSGEYNSLSWVLVCAEPGHTNKTVHVNLEIKGTW